MLFRSGFGHLTGKYLANPPADARLTLFPSFGARYGRSSVRPAVEAYVALARRHGMTPAELALAFVMSQGFVGSTIVGATSLAQLKENLQACSRVLDTHILAEIDDIHLQFTNPAP